MALFYTNSSAKAKVGELEAQISTLEATATTNTAEIERLTGEIGTATASLTSLQAEHNEAVAALETAETTIATLTADLTTAKAAVADFPGKVEAAARAKFAGLGGDPIGSSKLDDKDSKSAISGLTGHAKISAYFANKK